MLTYQQFIGKHANKYRGLSAGQKRQRYNTYVASQSQLQRNGQPTRQGRRRRRNRGGQGGMGQIDAALSPYARLYLDPFTADTCGLPVFPSPPSSKVVTHARGTFTIGTAGVGFVFGGPTTVNNVNSFFKSESTFTGTASAGSGTGVTPFGLPGLPFSDTQLNENSLLGVRARVVITGIRVKYIGTENNLGGMMYLFVHPEHADMASTSIAILGAKDKVASCSVSRHWCTAIWSPVFRTETEHYHTAVPPSHYSVEAPAATSPMIALVQSTPGNIFQYEIVQHIEYIGAAVQKTTNPPASTVLADRLDQLQDISNAIREDDPMSRGSFMTPERVSRLASTLLRMGITTARAYRAMRGNPRGQVSLAQITGEL